MKGNVALGNSLESPAHSKGEIDEVHLIFASETSEVSCCTPHPPQKKSGLRSRDERDERDERRGKGELV